MTTAVEKTSGQADRSQGAQEREGRHAVTPFEGMEHFMERVFPQGWLRPRHWEWPSMDELSASFPDKLPRVDVIDRDDELVVHAEMPGIEKNDVDISLTENTVSIKGSSKREEKEEKGDYYRCEISRGAYARTMTLPANIDPDKAKATFNDGVLELTLPKLEKTSRRTVKVE